MATQKLTVKQARFALEYCKDGNAKQAAIRSGYSEASAAEIGYENINKPHVFAAPPCRSRHRETRTT